MNNMDKNIEMKQKLKNEQKLKQQISDLSNIN